MKKHLVNCHSGDLRNLFLEEMEKAGCFSPMNGASHGNGDNCQEEWNGEVPWLYRRSEGE